MILKVVVSSGAVLLGAAHLIWPAIEVDAVTLGLIAVAVLPWLSSLLESAKLPGGWEVKFRDVSEAGKRIEGSTTLAASDLTPAYVLISDQDPNLALVGLRIEIERRLRALADEHLESTPRSLVAMNRQLVSAGILNDVSLSGLQELVHAGNQAAHGASVEPAAAQWALTDGPRILSALDAKLEGGTNP